MRGIKTQARQGRQLRSRRTVRLLPLLKPGRVDPEWEADKAGWRAYVFGHTASGFRVGSRLDRAWRCGYEAAERSADAVALML